MWQLKYFRVRTKLDFQMSHSKNTHTGHFKGVSEQEACSQDDAFAGNHDDAVYGDLPLSIYGPVEGMNGERQKDNKKQDL